IASVRKALDDAEKAEGARRSAALNGLASQLDNEAEGSSDAAKVWMLADAVRDLASSCGRSGCDPRETRTPVWHRAGATPAFVVAAGGGVRSGCVNWYGLRSGRANSRIQT